jgi:hypothetical protein
VRAVGMTIGCGIGLIVVWWGTAGQGVFARQVGWLTAGVAILIGSLYVHVSAISRARRAIGDRRELLLSNTLLDVQLSPIGSIRSNGWHLKDRTTESDVRVVAGLDMFHAPGCVMTDGREISNVSSHSAIEMGLEPCGICIESGLPAPSDVAG